MVWRAAVDGEARILLLLLACSAGVRRGGFFCFLRAPWLPACAAVPGRFRWLLSLWTGPVTTSTACVASRFAN